MHIRRFLLLAAFALLPASCITTKPMSSTQARASAKQSITVVSRGYPPMMRIIGTTVFNNEFEEISDPGFSFPEHMASVLRSRGYNAKVGDRSAPGLQLVLFPVHPYGEDYQVGEGIYWRSFLGAGGGFSAHCNYRASLLDKAAGLSKNQSVDWGGKGYFNSPTGIKRSIDSWAELSASEKATMKSALRRQMDSSARFLIKQLEL